MKTLKKLKTYIAALLPAVIGMASCTDELPGLDTGGSLPADAYFVIAGGDQASTRSVSYQGDASRFAAGDVLGLFVRQGDADVAQNLRYEVVEHGNAQSLRPLDQEAPHGPQYTYMFYYPYNPDYKAGHWDKTLDIDNMTFEVQGDQSTTQGLEKSDLLRGLAKERNGKVTVEMEHLMANIMFEIPENLVMQGSDVLTISYRDNNWKNVLTTVSQLHLFDTDIRSDGYVTGQNPSGTQSVKMLPLGKSGTGNLVFRAAIPAGKLIPPTLKYGQYEWAMFRITTPEGKIRSYRLKDEVHLTPGYTHLFTVVPADEMTPVPVPSDEDSWVLDVKTQDGRTVGLLCREYLRYQPTGASAQEEATGPEGAYDCLNSQAWVLYALDSRGVPILNEGKVLRFIYDIYYKKDFFFPEPHDYTSMPGIFTLEHGSRPNIYCYEGGAWGHKASPAEDYYYHGGLLTWDGDDNRITSFTKPSLQVDNLTAKMFGHITYNAETGLVDVSYDPSDRDFCVIEPKYIVDGADTYPMVKIGYNQFWMSITYHRDRIGSKELICYNDRKNGGVTFKETDKLEAGYIYPYRHDWEVDYDPAKSGVEYPVDGSTYYPARMYNMVAAKDPSFLPSPPPHAGYSMPRVEHIETMRSYMGPFSNAKLADRHLAHTHNGQFTIDKLHAIWRGESYGHVAYSANISGLNLRTLGYLESYLIPEGCMGLSSSRTFLMLDEEVYPRVRLLNFSSYDTWHEQPASPYWMANNNTWTAPESPAHQTYTQVFSQVRFFMYFDTDKSLRGIWPRATRSASPTGTTGFLHVSLEEI